MYSSCTPTSSGSIKIGVSGKGGEFVVLSQELDPALTRIHLQDATVYQQSSAQEFARQYRRLNKRWTDIARLANIPNSLVTRLRCDLPVVPVLYTLIKTHKLPIDCVSSPDPSRFKIRPIISCIGGPTDRVSWFLNLVIVQLLQFIPAHLPNTNTFLRRLRQSSFEQGCVMESFDVTALHTNVSNGQALEAV